MEAETCEGKGCIECDPSIKQCVPPTPPAPTPEPTPSPTPTPSATPTPTPEPSVSPSQSPVPSAAKSPSLVPLPESSTQPSADNNTGRLAKTGASVSAGALAVMLIAFGVVLAAVAKVRKARSDG